MRQEALQQIIDQLQTLADKAKALKSFFGDLTESGEPIFDISKEVPGRDLNYADCLTRLLKIAGMAKGMAAAEKAIMTPISRLTQLKAAISNVESRIEEIESRFNSIRNSYGGINSFDYSNFHIFGNNSQNQNFLPLFENFVDATEIILEQFYVVFVYVQPYKYKISFGNISNTLSGILQEEASKFQYFDQSAKKADNLYKDLEFILENAKSNIQNIEANSSESRNFKNKLNSIYQESIATKK